jgi:hypothetical protein
VTPGSTTSARPCASAVSDEADRIGAAQQGFRPAAGRPRANQGTGSGLSDVGM